jgi:hypothetical protein
MNLYNHLFYWIYSRQKTNYGRKYGVFSASMVLTLSLLLVLMDLQLALEVLKVTKIPFKPIPGGLLVILSIFGLNCLYYYSNNRYMSIERRFKGMSLSRLKRIRIGIILILSFLTIFFFIGANIARIA